MPETTRDYLCACGEKLAVCCPECDGTLSTPHFRRAVEAAHEQGRALGQRDHVANADRLSVQLAEVERERDRLNESLEQRGSFLRGLWATFKSNLLVPGGFKHVETAIREEVDRLRADVDHGQTVCKELSDRCAALREERDLARRERREAEAKVTELEDERDALKNDRTTLLEEVERCRAFGERMCVDCDTARKERDEALSMLAYLVHFEVGGSAEIERRRLDLLNVELQREDREKYIILETDPLGPTPCPKWERDAIKRAIETVEEAEQTIRESPHLPAAGLAPRPSVRMLEHTCSRCGEAFTGIVCGEKSAKGIPYVCCPACHTCDKVKG